MKTLLFLDDQRNPFLNLENKVPEPIHDWNLNWVRSYTEFCQWINFYGLPDAISFDHDLAPEHYTPEFFWDNYELSKKYQDWKENTYQFKTGNDCAIWLKEYCVKNNFELPTIYVHSANPVGKDKIKQTIL